MKELLDQMPESGYITHSNHGQQMRGHAGSISYNADVNTLHFYNSYFGSCVDQVHNLSTNSGKIYVRIDQPYPMYMHDFQVNVVRHHSAVALSTYICTDKEDLSVSLHRPQSDVQTPYIPNTSMNLQCTAYYKGFKKLGHYDNISLIKAMKSKLRACKAIIKENQNDSVFLDSIVCNNVNGILELHASPLMLD
jgi:hypothetical protein